mmetsp:Transcript_5501/g.21699  ORF Transcript_5501/g.21699 Transcript_5501/m.21699 type:complete len:204 (+) Transcript_5501:1080-1691(+)
MAHGRGACQGREWGRRGRGAPYCSHARCEGPAARRAVGFERSCQRGTCAKAVRGRAERQALRAGARVCHLDEVQLEAARVRRSRLGADSVAPNQFPGIGEHATRHSSAAGISEDELQPCQRRATHGRHPTHKRQRSPEFRSHPGGVGPRQVGLCPALSVIDAGASLARRHARGPRERAHEQQRRRARCCSRRRAVADASAVRR